MLYKVIYPSNQIQFSLPTYELIGIENKIIYARDPRGNESIDNR